MIETSTTTTTTTPTGASLWKLDPTHSSLSFAGRKMMISTVRGRFSEFDARVVGSDTDPESASIEVTVRAASVDSGFEARDQHLRSADFLAVDQFPTIDFRSTAVRRLEDERLAITGDLTIKGVTRPVTLETTVNGLAVGMSGARRAAFTAELQLDRHDWGITWNMPLGGDAVLVGRTITLQFELTFQETAEADADPVQQAA
jgi:polyisoprenoid-binding protein YceI